MSDIGQDQRNYCIIKSSIYTAIFAIISRSFEKTIKRIKNEFIREERVIIGSIPAIIGRQPNAVLMKTVGQH